MRVRRLVLTNLCARWGVTMMLLMRLVPPAVTGPYKERSVKCFRQVVTCRTPYRSATRRQVLVIRRKGRLGFCFG